MSETIDITPDPKVVLFRLFAFGKSDEECARAFKGATKAKRLAWVKAGRVEWLAICAEEDAEDAKGATR